MSIHFSDLPMVTCPHCDREFQKDDYYDVATGDDWECPYCNKTIYIHSVDHITQVRLSGEKPKD